MTPSQRPTREWALLLVTLALIGTVSFFVWQSTATRENWTFWESWTQARWTRLLFGPEQILCYICFLWASLILLSRSMEVRRQRKAFGLSLLPTEEGARILQADARLLVRKVDQVTGHRPYILANMIRVALGKFSTSRASTDVSEAVRMQAEVDQGRLVASMSTVQYLAWAIPAIGFLGTVRGLAGAMTMAGSGGEQLRIATTHLTVAFDCTLVALFLSLGVMFLIHMIQRNEESLVLDCQQYCLEHLVNRVYEPEHVGGGVVYTRPVTTTTGQQERLPR